MSNTIFNKDWWVCALVRALKTFCQGLITLIGVEYIHIGDIDWPYVLGVSATMALLSLLSSIAGLPEVETHERIG